MTGDETAPKRIWLNTAGCYNQAHGHADEMGVTWCKHPQDDDDEEYVRRDFYDRAVETLQEIARLAPRHPAGEMASETLGGLAYGLGERYAIVDTREGEE